MDTTFIVKIGEISLKKGNRGYFEKKLKDNILRLLPSKSSRFYGRRGRFFLDTTEPEQAELALAHTSGVVGYTRVFSTEKEIEAIREKAHELAEIMLKKKGLRFKVEARRSDKSFPLTSYGLAAELGHSILEKFKESKVDVKNPEWVLFVEIRDKAYLYADVQPGLGGLPVGSAGKGMLMLSGGIDSPVAAFYMAQRGLRQEAVYFHTYPYTSEEALQKVKDLAEIVSTFTGGMVLWVVPFTEAQLKLNRLVKSDEVTLIMRAAMMRVTDMLARNSHAKCIITGESLSQVASQTVESLRFTDSISDLPVFRPLIGLGKESIIQTARKMGSYEISILPYDDCCTIFSPKHPLTKPKFGYIREVWEGLDLDEELKKAADNSERFYFNKILNG
jgi:thiamine biosynthesis protein ThiI